MEPTNYREAFARIGRDIAALSTNDPKALQTQLEPLQRQAARLYLRAVGDACMRPIIADAEGNPLILWARLAEALEVDYSGELPAVGDIGRPVPIIGTGRKVYVTNPDRIVLWRAHAAAVVDLLAREAVGVGKPARPKRRGKPSTFDAKHDAAIVAAWDTRQYRRFAELDEAKGLPKGETRRAVDRHRKRMERRTDK